MKESTGRIYEELFSRYADLGECRADIMRAYEIMQTAYENGHKLLICGNGGSAADSEHIVGELLKSFKSRK